MIYAVIDTNVFVAALLSRHSNSATVLVVDTLLNHGICPLYNQEIINEYQDVLHRDKFHFPSESIDAIISTVTEEVKKDAEIRLIGFGTFKKAQRAARKGRNPQTGEVIDIAASERLAFKSSVKY